MAIPANGHVEMTVLGAASGQTIINVLNYKAHSGNAGTTTLLQLVAAFEVDWAAQICPLLHDSYAVQAYIGRLIGGMVYLPPLPTTPLVTRPALRYQEQHILQGVAGDVGTVATDAHPTFTACSAQKVCGIVTAPDMTTLTDQKLIKGGIRLGPIGEVATDATEGNELTAAFAAAALAGLNAVAGLTVGTETFFMEVLSFHHNNIHRINGVLPTFARALVNSFLVNPYASTQVTRKQRARGGA